MTEWISLPGLVTYNDGIELMEKRLFEVIESQKPEAIFLLEHEDVYTAGTGYKDSELLAGTSSKETETELLAGTLLQETESELLRAPKIPVIYTGRGGKFTYHGAGQRVIYPILDLRTREKDIRLYVKNLENWIINSLAHLGLKAYTIQGMVGIWVEQKGTHAKLGAIGVRLKKWVAYHGISINITTDLSKYSGIIPCGISNFPVTSLKELGIEVSMQEFDSILKNEFRKIF
ncbi:MAG: lipoate-protein ligase B [Rickettsiales bacterium]|nr:MAG: lipoate-protein ligase B [Rickettsiales bacterium]